MAVRLNLFSNTEQDTKKVSTVEELPQYMLKCIYDNNVAEESEEAKQEKMAKIKRKLEAGKKLTKEEKAYNRALSRFRVRVEHKIAALKRFKILAERFLYPRSTYATKFATIAGIVNLIAGF